MAKKTITRQKMIDILVGKLQNGTPEQDCVSFVVEKCRVSRRTGQRYVKDANKIHLTNVKAAREAAKEVYIDKEKEATEKGLNDKNKFAEGILKTIERLEKYKAGEIIQGVAKDAIVTPEMELKAIEVITKLNNQLAEWYAFKSPVKTDNIHKIETLTPIWGHIEPLLGDDTTDDSGE